MNKQISQLLKKTLVLSGAVLLGWAAKAQTEGVNNNTPADTTHRHGMHRGWAGRNGNDSLSKHNGHTGFRKDSQDRDGFGRGEGNNGMAFHGHNGFGGSRHGWAGRGEGIRYTPEQQRQVMAIGKEYRQKAMDLYKKDNSTLKEYKAGLIALQKEKKNRLEGLLTQQQKDERATRTKRMSENAQVMAAAHMERLKLRLNLSDDQVAKIKAGQETLHSQLKAIHENDNLLPRQKMEQFRDLRSKEKDLVRSVLTPDQQASFDKLSDRKGRGNGGPRGGRGGRGGQFGDHHPSVNGDDNQSK
jgi:hypothetical protein